MKTAYESISLENCSTFFASASVFSFSLRLALLFSSTRVTFLVIEGLQIVPFNNYKSPMQKIQENQNIIAACLRKEN